MSFFSKHFYHKLDLLNVEITFIQLDFFGQA